MTDMDVVDVGSDSSYSVECIICTLEYEKEENKFALTCGHVFHKECIDLWLNKGTHNRTCPLCRMAVPTIDMETNSSNRFEVYMEAARINILKDGLVRTKATKG